MMTSAELNSDLMYLFDLFTILDNLNSKMNVQIYRGIFNVFRDGKRTKNTRIT